MNQESTSSINYPALRFTLFLPILNEIEGLKLIMPRIRPEWVDEILFVDGGSTDGSLEYLKEHNYKVIHQKSKGICGAYWECLEAAEGDVIIAFSPDNNSIPELIPNLVSKVKEGNDLVVVSRYLDGAKSEDDDVVTAFGNWMFTSMVNILFNSKYTDTLVMFRAFRKDLVQEIGMDEKKTPTFEILLNIKCAKFNKPVAEIPGDEPPRIGGVRKMNPLYNGSTILIIIIKEFIRKIFFGR